MENANVLSVGNGIVLFDGSYLWGMAMAMSYLTTVNNTFIM